MDQSGTDPDPADLPPAGTRRRPGGRSARVREAVMAATIERLRENGYARLTIEDVAARAGVHKTSIYRRWGTKDRLVLDAILARSASAIQVPDTGNIEDDLLSLLRQLAADLASPLGRALAVATVRPDTEVTREGSTRHLYWKERIGLAAARLDRAKRMGQLPDEPDSSLIVEVLVSPLHFRTLVSGQAIDDEFLQAVVRLVLPTVRPHPAGAG